LITTFVKWGDEKIKLTWKPDGQLPSRNLITSVHGFCFKDDKLLLVKLNNRGWDFPGGHIENDETPEACIKREAYEEGFVSGSCLLLGYIIVDHSENPKWNNRSPYPKIGYQVFYRMDIDQVFEFEGIYESSERIFINPNEITQYYHDWNNIYQEILFQAMKNI